ncbi:hypothetical protein BJF79_46800 [Actinomadura sp. CNU-125]|nr:hypothetical protein [Actinomadura sp. CNU-125]OLT21351.1 hypothetical protein BJF79_46800 [Actinomadura sp. CNU-125]
MLLTGPDGAAWADALKEPLDLGVDAAAQIRDGDLTEVTGRLTDGHGIGPAGALLVRPDGYVAWRSPGPPVPDAPAAPTLRTVLRTVLSLDR